jgi:hypothetical protein
VSTDGKLVIILSGITFISNKFGKTIDDVDTSFPKFSLEIPLLQFELDSIIFTLGILEYKSLINGDIYDEYIAPRELHIIL